MRLIRPGRTRFAMTAAPARCSGSSPASRTTGRSTRTTLANAAIALKDPGLYPKFPPVADNLSAVVEFGQTWDSTPVASAIAYGAGNAVVASTIDLDPATAGQQTSITG